MESPPFTVSREAERFLADRLASARDAHRCPHLVLARRFRVRDRAGQTLDAFDGDTSSSDIRPVSVSRVHHPSPLQGTPFSLRRMPSSICEGAYSHSSSAVTALAFDRFSSPVKPILVRSMYTPTPKIIVFLAVAVVAWLAPAASAYGPYTFSKEPTKLLANTPALLSFVQQCLDVEEYSTNTFPKTPIIFRAKPKGSSGDFTLQLLIYTDGLRRIEIRPLIKNAEKT